MSEQPPETPTTAEWHGVWTVEGLMSGDGRQFDAGVLRSRPLPLPLLYQPETQMGHDGSVLVARVDALARVGQEIRATGVWDTEGEKAIEARRLVAEGFFRGVSVDVDDAKVEFRFPDGSPVPGDWWPEEGDPEPIMAVSDGRIAAATLVTIPAFAEAWVKDGPAPDGFMNGEGLEGADHGNAQALAVAVDEPDAEADTQALLDSEAEALLEDTRPVEERAPEARALLGRYEAVDAVAPEELRDLAEADGEDTDEPVAASLVAAALPQVYRPPTAAFANPGFHIGDHRVVQAHDGSWGCPLTITDDGLVYGHVAKWGTCHIGPQTVGSRECVTPPYSMTNYAYFATGTVHTAEGEEVHVGQLTIGTGHADPRSGLRAAASHYDNTGHVLADVAIGQDDLGIWIAGATRPGVSAAHVYAARASGMVSGDWREVGGNLELVAALVVNVPGFPMPRMAAGLQHNRQVSLVASGAVNPDNLADDQDAAVVRKVTARLRRLQRIDRLAASIGEDPRSRYQRAAALIGED